MRKFEFLQYSCAFCQIVSNLGLQWIINKFYFEREVFRIEYAFLGIQIVLLAGASQREGFRLP